MLLQRQATEQQDDHIDMTPMVDVVFQILTFMLFSSQMATGEKVEVPPARHGVGVEETAATFVTVMKPQAPGGESRLALGPGAGQTATMDQIRKAIADGVKQGKRKVVLQADGGVPHGDVLRLISAVSDLEGVTIHVGVQEPQ